MRRRILSSVLLASSCCILLAPPIHAQGSTSIKRIEVKFVDDLDIGVEFGEPRDRSGQALGSQAAVQLINEIAISGGEWDRLVRMEEARLDQMRATATANLGKQVGDLNNYFMLRVPDGIDAEQWMARLEALTEIEATRPAPRSFPAPLPDDFVDDQGYLDPATDGINAEWAWTLPGGTGANVVIADLEYSWNLSHQDLPGVTTIIPAGETGCDPFASDNHGTAVLGEMVSVNNGYGTTGAAYDAGMRVVPVAWEDGSDCDYHIAGAMTETIAQLVAGDIILIEQQTDGPNYIDETSQFGLVPSEWIQSFYNAVVIAIGNGIHVVAAAGNGSQNLDAPEYDTGHAPFKPGNDSGAIIVGGGFAPPGTDTDRSRRSSSCYGSRVNLQGWGHLVTTTGYGGSHSSEGKNLWYTDAFNGTSSASPIVTSAVALVESWHEQTQGGVMTPAAMRTLLMNTGSPQQSGINPASENIGPRPDILAAVCTFDSQLPAINSCPDDITVECTLNGQIWSGEDVFDDFFGLVSATDDIDPNPALEHNAPVNFPLGTTTVTWTATDACGNTNTCTADVTVVDTTAPEVSCPDSITVECSAFCGTPAGDDQLTAWFAGFSATDACDNDPATERDAPACFPLGSTTVTYTATDSEGNTNFCTAVVTVEDTTPPVITVDLNRYELWPPNHKYVDICATVEVTDICDENPTFILESAVSNEPDNGKGDGNTVNDIVADVGSDDVKIQLRSERSGKGDGRKYTLIYLASDSSGNTAADTVCVTVPHDQGASGNSSIGFTADGRDIDDVDGLFAVIVPSGQGFDPGQIDPARAQIGNHINVVSPSDFAHVDATGDGIRDLVLFYPATLVQNLRRGSVEVVSAAEATAVSNSKLVDGAPGSGSTVEQVIESTAVSLHFVTASGGYYRIEDIFALGAPLDYKRRTKVPVGFEGAAPAIGELPHRLALRPFPNPVSGDHASVELRVPLELAGGSVSFQVFDLEGRMIHDFGGGTAAAGVHRLDWSLRSADGGRVPNGVYFYKIHVGDKALTQKFVVIGE